ncbi:hypothetical protein Patl1_03977 [Pistacia atlantica]|uniref:Uncharacterized protein n=1 Tax=Pistacia atlantica TaxID=434234 RepID=A0ACC1BUR1_9ROSI|nr:hypothetical protein Patl1_03977 [Pistacia atlantica]
MWGLPWKYLVLCLLFLFLHLQAIFSVTSNCSSPSPQLRSSNQSFVLLHFKNAFLIHNSASIHCSNFDSFPKTESWKLGSDCCSWDGVTCDRSTGHVIGLDLSSSQLIGKIHVNSSIFLLHHLRSLNLACNDFMFSEISSNFAQFTKLIHLNLSSSNFSGLVPSEISHLSKLGSLDLSDNNAGHGLEIGQHCFNKILQNLTEVRYLLLDNVNMSSVVPGFLVNFSSSLISLSLSNTQLRHEFPNGVFRLPFLQQLSLSRNGGLIGNLPESNWSSPLRLLDLSLTKFSGILPETIGDLIHLNVLDLSYCKFTDSIPRSLWNLTGSSLVYHLHTTVFPDNFQMFWATSAK